MIDINVGGDYDTVRLNTSQNFWLVRCWYHIPKGKFTIPFIFNICMFSWCLVKSDGVGLECRLLRLRNPPHNTQDTASFVTSVSFNLLDLSHTNKIIQYHCIVLIKQTKFEFIHNWFIENKLSYMVSGLSISFHDDI